MKTKLFRIACVSILSLIMVSCSKDEATHNTTQDNTKQSVVDAYQYKGQPPITMKKNADNLITKTIKFYEAEGPFEFNYNVEGCSPSPVLTVSGSGIASHLGLYTVVNQGCYDGLSLILGTITAADGDEIHTYIASAEQDMTTGLWYYHYVIYNGTGNFDGAFGDIYMEGTLDFENFMWNLKGEGTITN